MFERLNPLEKTLKNARSGKSQIRDFLQFFSQTDIAVPSGAEVQADGSGFVPLLFDKAGRSNVACFTDMKRARSFSKTAPYCILMKGGEFLKRIPPGYGVVVNPGEKNLGFDISPEGLQQIIRDFC